MKLTKTLSALLAAITLLFTASAPAQFIQKTATYEAFTNASPYLITASSITNLTTATNWLPVQVSPNQGMSFFTRFAAAGAGTSPLRFTFHVSADGTNYSNANPLEFFTAPNGTAGVNDFTNFPTAALNNIRWIRLTSISNTTAQVIGITNATLSVFR